MRTSTSQCICFRLLSTCLVFLCLHCHAQAQEPDVQADEWKQDARLSRLISLRLTGIPLKETVSKLQPSGVQLTVDTNLAEQKVQMVVVKRPLPVLMASLAEIFQAEWRSLPDHSGYKLTMKPSAIRYRSNWWAIYEQERERAFSALTADMIAAMNTPLPPFSSERDGPRNPSAPDYQKIQEFFAALSPQLQQQVASLRNDTNTYSLFEPADIPNDDENVILISFTSLPEAAQNALLAQRPGLAHDVVLHFSALSTEIVVNVFGSDGKNAMSTMTMMPQHGADYYGFRLDHTWLLSMIDRKARKEKTAPATWKQLLAYQRSHVWPNALPRGEAPLLPPRRAEVLDMLAQQQHIEFVADYHSTPGRPLGATQDTLHLSGVLSEFFSPTLKPENAKSLTEQLNARALEQDMSWKQQDGLYLFRDNRWYRDDLLEVPAAQARDWLKRYGTLTKRPRSRSFWTKKRSLSAI